MSIKIWVNVKAGGSTSYSLVSGTYPATGTSGTTGTVTITNSTGATVYIYGGYYMAGASGAYSATFYMPAPETISGTGSPGVWYYTTGYYTLTNGSTTTSFAAYKGDSLGTGAACQFYYATSIGGAKSAIGS